MPGQLRALEIIGSQGSLWLGPHWGAGSAGAPSLAGGLCRAAGKEPAKKRIFVRALSREGLAHRQRERAGEVGV